MSAARSACTTLCFGPVRLAGCRRDRPRRCSEPPAAGRRQPVGQRDHRSHEGPAHVTFSTTTREGQDAAQPCSRSSSRRSTPRWPRRRRPRKPGQLEVQTGNFSLYPRYAAKGGITGWQGRAELVVEGARHAGHRPAHRPHHDDDDRARRLRPVARAAREGRRRCQPRRRSRATAPRRPTMRKQFGYAGYTIREVNVSPTSRWRRAVPMMRGKAMSASADESLPVEAGKGTRHRDGQRHRADEAATKCAQWHARATARSSRRRPPRPRRATLSAAGEHRNTASSPSCSGVVNCSDGCFSASRSRLACSVDDAFAGGTRVDLLLHQRRQHPARADRVDRDAGRRRSRARSTW